MGIVEETLKKLKVEDKIRLTYGEGYWMTLNDVDKIPSKIITDGPHGVRLQNHDLYKMFIEDSIPSMSYPSLSSLANSFDEKLVGEVSKEIGLEANKLNVSLLLGPGINIKRHPRGGRNFEYFSEDPILAGRLGYAYVKGIEPTGVGSTLKHFCLNNQEELRFLTNSVVDERTLRELYLKPFELAVKAKPTAIMTSYNMVNNVYSSDNKHLLRDVMRKEYGFKGLYISDWGGRNDPIKSLKAGLSLEMPAFDRTRNHYVYEEYKKGNISEKDIDRALKPLLKFLLKEKKNTTFDIEKAKKVALKASESSMVLLKNEDNILPLKNNKKILVVGGFFKDPRFQGSGSSKVCPSYFLSPMDSFNNHNVKYDYIEGFDTNSNITNLDEVLNKAKEYSKVLIFTGLPIDKESEGFDRETLDLPENYVKAICEISSVNPNTVVVVTAGSQTNTSYDTNIKGLLYAYLGGGLVGEAIYNILFGKYNPSARLAETFVNAESDTYLNKNFPCEEVNNKYSEGLYVGYPYYYINNIKPKYNFGYGLSYSKFTYSNFNYDNDQITLDITNSSVKGIDTLFLFIRDEKNYIRLKDFKKIELKCDESKEVSFEIKDEFFKFYSDLLKKEVVGSGSFDVLIGTSLDNIIYSKNINVVGETDYVHPEFNLNLTKGLHKKSKKYTITSTLADFKGTKYFDMLEAEVNKGPKIEDIKDLMTRHEKMVEFSHTPLRFYTLYVDLSITTYMILGVINDLNGNSELGNYYLNQKNKTLDKDKNKNS